jgi:hypothetical protein
MFYDDSLRRRTVKRIHARRRGGIDPLDVGGFPLLAVKFEWPESPPRAVLLR